MAFAEVAGVQQTDGVNLKRVIRANMVTPIRLSAIIGFLAFSSGPVSVFSRYDVSHIAVILLSNRLELYASVSK